MDKEVKIQAVSREVSYKGWQGDTGRDVRFRGDHEVELHGYN